MSSYSAAVKTARMTVVRDAIDAGAGPGILEIGTTGFATILATITLQDPSFTVDGDHLHMNGTPSDIDADNTGVAAIARFKDSNGNVIINNVTVGIAGDNAEMTLNSKNVQQHVIFGITSCTITHAA